jgi:hypothetical protein
VVTQIVVEHAAGPLLDYAAHLLSDGEPNR